MATQFITASGLAPRRAPWSLGRVLARVGAMAQARQTRRILAEMDDRLLADIGTSRGDAATEANRAFWDIR